MSLTFDLLEERREFPSVAAHSAAAALVWVLSGMWGFSSRPLQTGSQGAGGWAGEGFGGKSKVQKTAASNKAADTVVPDVKREQLSLITIT